MRKFKVHFSAASVMLRRSPVRSAVTLTAAVRFCPRPEGQVLILANQGSHGELTDIGGVCLCKLNQRERESLSGVMFTTRNNYIVQYTYVNMSDRMAP